MNVRSGGLLLACAVFLTVSTPTPALAQSQPIGDKKKALELYDKAKIQYDLGHWEQAIQLWVQAYETFNAPEFLFNIAQAYRQSGNCERALFFYRRYLATKPNAKNRDEVEAIMKELEGSCGKTSAPPPGTSGSTGPSVDKPAGDKPPGGKTPGTGGTAAGRLPAEVKTGPSTGQPAIGHGPEMGEAGGDVTDESDEGADDGEYEGNLTAPAAKPHLFAVRVAAGPSFPSFGDLDVSPMVALSLGGGHPMDLGSVVLEPGAVVTYNPVRWRVEQAGDPAPDAITGTAGLICLLANLGASREFLPKFSGRLDVGVGVLLFTGLSADGNPFLQMGEHVTDGAIPLFATRVALGAEYALTPNFILYAQPGVFSWSPSSPLRDDIKNILRFEMLVGAGYQM